MGKRIACLGDPSNHGGNLSSTNQSGKALAKGDQICVEGCTHTCPIEGHGTTNVSAIALRTLVEGRLVITEGAMAGCGAIIQPPDRGVLVE